jgi:hypothetical protein
MEFADAQDFTGVGIDHDFAHEEMVYGSGSTFNTAEIFGADADFADGIQTFAGTNTFKDGTSFAASQTFTAVQTFDGSNTFGAGVEFGAAQNFGAIGETSAAITIDAVASTLEWANIFDAANGGAIDTVSATGSGTFSTGVVYADYNAAPTFGEQINDVVFTDANNNGIIDCASAGACELADLTIAVTLANGSVITFEQDSVQTFGLNTEFTDGTSFGNEQTFATTMDFSDGDMTFADGMEFADAQDFTGVGIDHDFAHEEMVYGSGSTFNTAETFGDDADFDDGIQTFAGTNTFGEDSSFATSQTFAAVQTFDGENTFGASTEFADSQDFSTAGTVTSASIAVATNVLINDMTKQNAAFPSISASSGAFESGTVTITFSDTDNASEDKIQEVLFTDTDKDGIIDDGELGAITAVTTSSDTMIITQSKTQDFDAGAQTFGTDVTFNDNQKFSDDVQTFGTGTTFGGNAAFNAGQTFTASTTFDDGQEFAAVTNGLEATAFAATGITFGDEEPVEFADNDLTFGAEASFPKNQDFSAGAANNFSAADINFDEGTLFHASETFGAHVDFEGAITFPDGIDMSSGAEFAAQTFANGATPDFGAFSTFADNTIFGDTSVDFSTNAHFEGDTTFGSSSTHTFGEGTVFDGAIDMGDGAHVFNGDSIDFGPSSDLTGAVQNFAAGTTATIPQFGVGTTFADNQVLPTGTVLSTGILLNGFTCDVDDVDFGTTCLTTVDADILTKGEIITPGETAPPAVKNTISADDTTVSIDGLGVSVDFTSITTDGNLSVAIQDPDDTVAATGATLTEDGSGALEFTASGLSMTTVSSVIDFDLTGSTASSGGMTITLPYDEVAAEAAGFDEDNLEVSHYVGGEWVVENNCTVDTVNNEITCFVTSIE